MRQVLVAVDDSPASERVSDFVKSFFGGLDVSIVAINVGAAPLAWGPYPAAPGLLYGWPFGPGGLPVEDPTAVEAGADSVHAVGEATLEASGWRPASTWWRRAPTWQTPSDGWRRSGRST